MVEGEDERRARIRTENLEHDRAVEASVAACPDPVAARALRDLMSAISERCFFAGWLQNLERDLWALPSDGLPEFGLGSVTSHEAARLRELAARCDGWWRWRDDDPGESFVRLADWVAETGRV